MSWATGTLAPVGREAKSAEVLEARCAGVDISDEGDERARVEWGRETLFVNASIMDVGYAPENAPWVVEVGLPVRSEAERRAGGLVAVG